MKLLIIFFLIAAQTWARPIVLISYFDPFGHARFNNSELIAKTLEKELNLESVQFEVKTCKLNTIYNTSYAQLENCYKNLEEKPIFTISLGESICGLKIETMARNWDSNPKSPDNAGTYRRGSKIFSEGAEVIGMKYPLPQMYCALPAMQRKKITVSNDAGSFVCNNTAYQMAHYYPEVQYGFIHVPANNCQNLKKLNEESTGMLKDMIKTGVKLLLEESQDVQLPHTDNDVRLPTKKNIIKSLRSFYRNNNQCLEEYFNRTKPYNQRGLFSGIMN